MPTGSCLVDETNLSRDSMMASSRLLQSSESSDSDSEHRPSFSQKTSVISRAPKKRNHEVADNVRDFGNKRVRYDVEDYDDHDDHEGEKNIEEQEDDETGQSDAEKTASNIGERLMQKMGYAKGKGLGKSGQGRLEPVEAFKQKGRRGLGHDNPQLREATLKWDPEAEVVCVQEDMLWLTTEQDCVSADDLHSWLHVGPSKETIDDEVMFCDPHIVEQVINSKSIFDNLDKNEMRRARTRSNPFETIRGAFFLNRAAVKMANIDKACEFMFTYPKGQESNEPLYFADVCAGPGGFSEYVLWRRKWQAKGFGFTLKDSNDFKIDDFYAGSPETFHPFYGPKENGDVYDPANQEAFRKLIMSQTRGRGVHFMMSDGGFSVDGKENIQEILSKQLYLCQCLVALMIVRENGHFVTKVFDLFTPFSAGLVYLMYRCFRSVCIFKPNTSRPANSERYLICQGKLPDTEDVLQHLKRANRLLLLQDKSKDVMELVPMEVLQSDENFYQYLRESNESLARKQVVGLLKIAAYCEDTTLFEHRQAQMKKECLEYWDMPDQSRTAPKHSKPDFRLETLIGSGLNDLFKKRPSQLEENIELVLKPPCDWFCVPCEAGSNSIEEKRPTIYFGMGRSKVYRFVGGTFQHVGNIELPPDTLILAEIVTEFRGEHKTQSRTTGLHIIDAWYLGGDDISRKYLPDRHALIHKFCEALWKPENNPNLWRVRPKELCSLDDDLMRRLNLGWRTLKNGSKTLALPYNEPPYTQNVNEKEEPVFMSPNSVMFLKCTQSPWSLHLSRSTNHHYFFNSKTDDKFYNDRRPDSAVAPFSASYENRVVWFWPNDSTISMKDLYDEIKNKCPYKVMAN